VGDDSEIGLAGVHVFVTDVGYGIGLAIPCTLAEARLVVRRCGGRSPALGRLQAVSIDTIRYGGFLSSAIRADQNYTWASRWDYGFIWFCVGREGRQTNNMSHPPQAPKIYHIVHVDKLAAIAEAGLFSDAAIRRANPGGTVIGMNSIKDRRLSLPVSCHQGTFVGDYVPFYFCSRSIMLYVIHCANHPELAYRGGQGPIVHLEADLYETIRWADGQLRRWAFTSANAGAYYTEFHAQVAALDQLNWPAIAERDFRSADVKEAKQSEFLVHDRFPWELVRRIGVRDNAIAARAHEATQHAAHRPPIEIQSSWYY